jgi:hypothetical protein
MNNRPFFTISARIERGSLVALERIVKHKGLTKSEFVRQIVNEAIIPGNGNNGAREQNGNQIGSVHQSNGGQSLTL